MSQGLGHVVPMRLNVIAAAMGNFLEFYDFILFAIFSPVIARVYFPSADPANAILLAFATLGVAAFTRPIGAIVIGAYSDRVGRKAGLTLTILIMAFATMGIGLLPGYASLGVAAPVLLVVLRLLQGFSTGGEFGGATAFLAEHAPPRWRGFYAGWLQTGTFASAILASGLAIMVHRTGAQGAAEGWSWRIPFVLGGVLAPLGFYVRRKLPETALFEAEKRAAKRVSPLAMLLKSELGMVLRMVGVALPAGVGSYVILLYLPHYAALQLHLSDQQGLYGAMFASAASAALCPVAGAISDVIGRKRLMGGAMLFSAASVYPLFTWLIASPDFTTFVVVSVLLGILLGFFAGPMTALGPELFATGSRSTGLSIGYGLSVAIFGNFTPLILAWGIARTGNATIPALYLGGALLAGALAVFWGRDHTGQSLAGLEAGDA